PAEDVHHRERVDPGEQGRTGARVVGGAPRDLLHHRQRLERLRPRPLALRELPRADEGRGPGVRAGSAADCLVASTSIVIATSSPTIRPPLSIALLQLMPKSLRLIFVVAWAPARVFPIGSLMGGVTSDTSSTTSLVTPCRVRSPVTLKPPAPAGSIFFDLKVMVGYF